MWYGFDKPGNSLGISQTGEMLTSPLWGNYMRDIHNGLPQKSFPRPSGVSDAGVCRASGLLAREACPQTIYLPFLAGTVPNHYCDMHGAGATARLPSTTSTQINELGNIDTSFLDNIPRPTLQLDLFPELQNTPNQNNRKTTPPVTLNSADDDYLPPWDQLD